jgi:hypothetical protein
MQSIGEGDRPILGWDALNQLPASVECGAHSHTHPQLDLVSLFGAEVKVRYFYLTSSVGRPNITTDQFARLLTQQSTRVERQLRSIAASGWRQVRRIRTRLEN